MSPRSPEREEGATDSNSKPRFPEEPAPERPREAEGVAEAEGGRRGAEGPRGADGVEASRGGAEGVATETGGRSSHLFLGLKGAEARDEPVEAGKA